MTVKNELKIIKEFKGEYKMPKVKLDLQMFANKSTTACFTGRRPNKLDNVYNPMTKEFSKIRKAIRETIIANNIHTVYTGMALGIDQIAALAALELKQQGYDIKIIAAIPCKNQECRWTKESQELYHNILQRCDEQIVLSDTYTNDCMQKRNEYMVNNSDLVIAYWNGTSGGTGNTIQYAKKINKSIINLYKNNKENNSSCVVSPCETSTQEVLNNKKKEENNMKNKIINNLAIGDIEFIDLTPSMFKGNTYVLNKYFHYKDHSLDRPYLPELDKETYENHVKNWSLKNEANRKYETATDYFKTMVKKQIVAKDLGIENYKRLSFKGYKGDSENFEFSNYADNQRWLFEEKYIEDMFDPDRNQKLNLDRKNSPYIIGDYKDELNEAWQFLTLCIRGRLVMLLNLENLVFTINNFIKNTEGLTQNCSDAQIAQLTNPIKNALKMLKDKELNAWIRQGNNDMTLYVINGDENTRKDYVETYQKILRAMLNIKPNESLEYFKDVFHYTNKYYPDLKDKYENIILRNEGLEIENLWDSQSADYDEDNEESIVDNPEYYENVLLNN